MVYHPPPSGLHPRATPGAEPSAPHITPSSTSSPSSWQRIIGLALASFGGPAVLLDQTQLHALLQRPLLAWHPTAPLLATADAQDRVHVAPPGPLLPPEDPTGQTPHSTRTYVLAHELQTGIQCLAWRPAATNTLAVGCAGGVLIWSLDKGPSCTPMQKPGSMWVTMLPTRAHGPATCMAWSSCGTLLAVGVGGVPGMQVWDVATARVVTVQQELAEVRVLSWSPCGGYLLASDGSGGFCVWETTRWRMRKWAVRDAKLVAAQWAPDSSCCLLIMSPSAHSAVLYFTSTHPSLEVQFLPLVLQGFGGEQLGKEGIKLFGAAWDPQGSRLVLGFMGADAVPHVAVFSTTFKPVLHAMHIGNQPLGHSAAEDPPSFAFAQVVPEVYGRGALLGVLASRGGTPKLLPLPLTK